MDVNVYKSALNKINATEDFKKQTIELLKENGQKEKKPIRSYMIIGFAVACGLALLVTIPTLMNTSNNEDPGKLAVMDSPVPTVIEKPAPTVTETSTPTETEVQTAIPTESEETALTEKQYMYSQKFGTTSVALEEDWIYYAAWDFGLYKIKPNGTKKTQLSKEWVDTVAISDDWIYYVVINQEINRKYTDTVYKMKKDGTKKTEIKTLRNTSYHNISGDWFYYTDRSDKYQLYKCRLDGTEKTRLNDKHTIGTIVSGEWVYFVDSYFEKDKTAICRTSTDGKRTETVFKSPNSNHHISNFVIYEDWIYFFVANENKLKKVHINGGKAETLLKGIEVFEDEIAIFDGWIYFADKNKDLNIYKVRTDGTGKTKLSSDTSRYVSFFKNNIYYIVQEYYSDVNGTEMQFNLYKIGIDGKGRKWIDTLKRERIDSQTLSPAVSPTPEKTEPSQALPSLFENIFSPRGIVITSFTVENGITVVDGWISDQDYESAAKKIRECLDAIQNSSYSIEEYSGIKAGENAGYSFRIKVRENI